MTATIPTIDKLPTTCADAARFIWEHQDKLNQLSHPKQLGTVRLDKHLSPSAHEAVGVDYHLALISEVEELFSNCYFKHWSAEAKAGHRWGLINPNASTGEGTAQNVLVEIIDIAFFTVSALQVFGMTKRAWVEQFGDEGLWVGAYGNPQVPPDMKEIVHLALDLSTAVGNKPFRSHHGRLAICGGLRNLCIAAGLNWNFVLDLYARKLVKNHERQMRGRMQVGDTMAEQENASVAISADTAVLAPKETLSLPAK